MPQSFNPRSNLEIIPVSSKAPCPHCGKPNWCYSIGELTACKRGAEPATGWEQTSKADKEGTPYYAPIALKKTTRPKAKKDFFYHGRDGKYLIKVVRLDDGNGKKSFPQYHWSGDRWVKGVPEEIQKQVPIYRYQQVRKAIADGRPVFMVEGEGCADALWSIGICATTTLGGSGKYKSYGNYLEDLAGAALVLCPDRDQPGTKHMEAIASDFPEAQWLYAPPGDFYWQHLPASQGLDISDWIASGATADDIKAAVTDQRFGLPSQPYVETVDTNVLDVDEIPLTAPTPDEVFTQKAIDELYSDIPWISVDNNLYKWHETHYKLVSPAAEKARIARWCNTKAVESPRGWSYAYAKPHIVNGIFDWLLVSVAVDPELVNPPGLNCLNGVLQINWIEKIPSWSLVPHNPKIIYTYVGEFEFNPGIESIACDQLLSCLDLDQQEIFIKTLAASLDLQTIRNLKGRGIKALICKGDGNNGKDSLREAVALLYGISVVDCPIEDFVAYQQGRKFPLAKLEHARVSWASENSNLGQLDSLQPLKRAITGETLDFELKNQSERPMRPCCVFLFSINNVPNLQASLEAIKSRWAVLSFNKTFKANADPSKGEIEADPRFRYDPNFLKREVVPALLNKMLEALPEVAARGIDYRCTEMALEEIQQETNHLRNFCQETGLTYQPGKRVYINDLWEKLRNWYIANGTLEITIDTKGKEKTEWYEQPRRGDRNVKAANQVHQRFAELFPKIVKRRDFSHGDRHGLFFLTDLAFGSAMDQQLDHQLDQQKALQGAVDQHGSPISTTLAYALELIAKLTPIERQFLVSTLTGSSKEAKLVIHADPPLPERVTADPTGDPTADPTGDPTGDPKPALTNSANNSNASMQSVTASSGSNVVGGIGNVTHDNSTKNFPSANQPAFKVGDRVAHSNPGQKSYNWHGRIIAFHQIGSSLMAEVKWRESRRKEPFVYELSDLRLI